MSDTSKLTPKQRRFCDAYLGEAKGNGSEAARIAGYALPREQAYENLSKPDIRAYIDERLDAETLRSAEVLRELTDVARAEWRDFLEVVTDPRTGAILRVRMDLSGKVKALELLGKHHKLFTDKSEQTNTLLVREYGDGDH